MRRNFCTIVGNHQGAVRHLANFCLDARVSMIKTVLDFLADVAAGNQVSTYINGAYLMYLHDERIEDYIPIANESFPDAKFTPRDFSAEFTTVQLSPSYRRSASSEALAAYLLDEYNTTDASIAVRYTDALFAFLNDDKLRAFCLDGSLFFKDERDAMMFRLKFSDVCA